MGILVTGTALDGCAYGDALGAPFEFHPEAAKLVEYAARAPGFVTINRNGVCRNPGIYTDDTQLAAMLYILALEEDIPPHAASSEFMKALNNTWECLRGTGKNLRETATTCLPKNSFGTGSSMRVVPLHRLGDTQGPQYLLDWVAHSAVTTTTHPSGIVMPCLLALYAWTLGNPDLKGTLKDLQYPTRITRPAMQFVGYTGDTTSVPSMTIPVPEREWERGRAALRNAVGNPDPQSIANFSCSSGYTTQQARVGSALALTDVPWCMLAVKQADTFEEALIQAASCGGDVDTLLAITGALAAIKFGGVPKKYLQMPRPPGVLHRFFSYETDLGGRGLSECLTGDNHEVSIQEGTIEKASSQ